MRKNILQNFIISFFTIAAFTLFTVGCGNKQNSETQSSSTSSTDSLKVIREAMMAKFSNVNPAEKQTLDQLSLEEGSVASQILKNVSEGFNNFSDLKFKNVNFSTGSADLSKETENETDQLAAILKVYPDLSVAFEGHTDNSGDATLNQYLSEERVKNIQLRLVKMHQVDSSRVSIAGFGQEKPISTNDTADGKALNNRIEVKILN
ncbi:MAG: OmpA family protein [Saprospiraceae bacterium]|nr:OmpA family protein [Saprospiraceae bacterium]